MLMEAGLWISVVILLVGIFASWFIQGHWTRKSIERMDERMAKAIAPLAEVTASIKTEVRGVEKKIMRRRKRIR